MRQLGNLMCAGMAVVVMGCANLPTGPSVMVLPAEGRPFEQFQAQDTRCRQWVARQVGSPGSRATENLALGTVAGTTPGAAVEAAIGATRRCTSNACTCRATSFLMPCLPRGTPPPPPERDADVPALEPSGRVVEPDVSCVEEDHTCGDGQAARPAE